MSTISYWSAIRHVARKSPTLDKPSDFINWAEEMCDLISHIYGMDYDQVTHDIYEAAKDEQGWDDPEEDED